MSTNALVGAAIHDGETLHQNSALLIERGHATTIMPVAALPEGCPQRRFDGGTLLPGFVDLQVNGGGGVMFNDAQDVATLATIGAAHAKGGTAGLLATLITDTPERNRAAIRAVAQAMAENVDGIAGLHLEGPHLAKARKGAHDPTLIRRMEDADLDLLLVAADTIANVMVTLAAETVTPAQISQLAQAGIVVSLGHSDAGYDVCMAAIDAGARCTTHLFNAMSQFSSREPGLVGATLDSGGLHAGMIADAIHVHPATMRAALRAKAGPGEVFLVTDAMAPAGTDMAEFLLNGRRILRRDGRLTLDDGTLAGADLDMARAIAVMVTEVGLHPERAIAMATSIPARLLRDPLRLGGLIGAPLARICHLDTDFSDITRLS